MTKCLSRESCLCNMQMYIIVFESDDYCRMLRMYCVISDTCDAIRSIKNEGFIPIDTEYRNFQS